MYKVHGGAMFYRFRRQPDNKFNRARKGLNVEQMKLKIINFINKKKPSFIKKASIFKSTCSHSV